MFEKASRLKLRFETKRGNVMVEDLWDIPLLAINDGVCLDDIAKSLNKALKESEEESFVVEKSEISSIIELKFSIVKRVIKTKLHDKEEEENAVARKAKKEKILSIMAEKEDDALKNKSVTSLKKILDEL